MATLIWTERAVADLEEIGQFILKDNLPAAEKVGSRIFGRQKMSLPFPVSAASFQSSATRKYERSSLNRIELFLNSTKRAI